MAQSKVAKGLGILALAVGATAGTGEYYADDPLMIPRNLVDVAVYQGAAPVDQKITSMIDHLAHEPSDPAYVKLGKKLDDATLSPHASKQEKTKAYKTFIDDYTEYSMSKAAELGLHISDYRPYIQRVDNAKTFEQTLQAFQDYGKTLGLDINLHTHKDLKDLGIDVTPIDPMEIQFDDKLKNGIISFITEMAFIPKELYDFTDIKEVRIVSSLGVMGNSVVGDFQPAGEANCMSGILYIPLDSLYTGQLGLFGHEMAHRLDYKMNGSSTVGQRRDVHFVRLNRPDFRYGVSPKPGDDNVSTEYGATNPKEDKAMLMESMLSGADSTLLNSHSPVIRAKYRMLLGRLEQHVPGIAKYLMHAGS